MVDNTQTKVVEILAKFLIMPTNCVWYYLHSTTTCICAHPVLQGGYLHVKFAHRIYKPGNKVFINNLYHIK